ncbi:MAG: NrtA/SsuA/CpmA family ABC transporter substrate-binding protein [Oligoflexia bacterium]|nr:NrtA/SsuA/CpmA family ABC transporter substrate-binding protein [Oligoflexia bacterium]
MKHIIVLIAALFLSSCQPTSLQQSNIAPPLRIGWITTWATAGQVMEVLARTDIAKQLGLKLDLKTYSLGPQMNEAALQGELDGIVIGVVPTVSLLAADQNWSVVARIVDFNQATLATKASASDLYGLRGKRIGVPLGSGAHPYLLHILSEHGIMPKDVTLINMKPPEQVLAFGNGLLDAVSTWEPVTTILQRRYGARIINRARHSGFLTLKNSVLLSRADEVKLLLTAIREAHYYNATHRSQVDEWFASTSGFDLAAIHSMEIIEANFSAPSLEQVKIELSDQTISEAQVVADSMYRFGLTREPLHFAARVQR